MGIFKEEGKACLDVWQHLCEKIQKEKRRRIDRKWYKMKLPLMNVHLFWGLLGGGA